ncbi:MAG: metallophosphoesterase family protein [Acutalibacteraceae bacterium]
MEKFKFFVITDPHWFSEKLGAYGEGYEAFMDYEQKCYAETAAINRAVNEYLKNSTETDTILIAGDLSFNGEKESHIEYSKELKALKDSGKRVFVVTAGHDIEKNPFQYRGGEREAAEGIKFGDLLDYYGEFGYNDAIAFNREHLSYVAQLSKDVRLLVLCNDTTEGKNVAYDDEFLKWIEDQAKKAKADGKMMIAMEHYPVLPGQPVLTLIPDARQKESKKLIETLADNGVHLIFTGHMHNQSVNVVETEKGNKFYDVCTGSLIGCPAFMRLVTIEDENTVSIESIPVPEFHWDKKGKSGEEYLQAQFDRMLITLIGGMKDNPEKVLHKFGAGDKTALYKPMKLVGKILYTWSVGKVARLFLVKAHPDIKNDRFFDYLVSLVRNMFCGDQPYTEDTPFGETFLKVLKRLNPVLKILNKKLHGAQGETLDFYDMLKNTAGNYGISDYNATLKF